MARPEAGMDYLHSYRSVRPWVDWNRCAQAAVATMLDYHRLDPYGLPKPVYDERDGRYHWDDGEIIDRIKEGFPPDHALGLFGTTPGRIRDALASAGLEACTASSRRVRDGRRIWEEVRRSAAAGLPVIVIMDMGKLGGRPFTAHWGVVYGVQRSTVRLANTGMSRVPEELFLRAFRCRFMLPAFNHCAVFCRPHPSRTKAPLDRNFISRKEPYPADETSADRNLDLRRAAKQQKSLIWGIRRKLRRGYHNQARVSGNQ